MIIRPAPIADASIEDITVINRNRATVPGMTVKVPSLYHEWNVVIEVQVRLKGPVDFVVRRLMAENGDFKQLLDIDGEYFNIHGRKVESIKKDSFSVEPVEQKTLGSMQLLKSMLDEAADATMQTLGQNRLNDTSVKVTQSQVMSSLSGVEERFRNTRIC